MCAKVKFLAVVPESNRGIFIYKAFFFCKESNHLLSVKIDKKTVDFLIRRENMKITEEECYIAKLLKFIGVKSIRIDKNKNSYAVTFRIKKFWWKREIQAPFYYGIMLSSLYKIPLETKEVTLINNGIKINREILQESLIDTLKQPSFPT